MGKGEVGRVLTQQPYIPAVKKLLACPLCLITVEKSLSTLRPAHYTLREYLSYNTNFTSSMVPGGLLGLPQYSACQGLFPAADSPHLANPAC